MWCVCTKCFVPLTSKRKEKTIDVSCDTYVSCDRRTCHINREESVKSPSNRFTPCKNPLRNFAGFYCGGVITPLWQIVKLTDTINVLILTEPHRGHCSQLLFSNGVKVRVASPIRYEGLWEAMWLICSTMLFHFTPFPLRFRAIGFTLVQSIVPFVDFISWESWPCGYN